MSSKGFNAYAALLQRTGKAGIVAARGQSNGLRMCGFVLSVFRGDGRSGGVGGAPGVSTTSGGAGGAGGSASGGAGGAGARVKYHVTIQLGSFDHDDEAELVDGVMCRRFTFTESKTMDKCPKEKRPASKELIVRPYSQFKFDIDEKAVGAFKLQRMQAVEIQSIIASYWFLDVKDKPEESRAIPFINVGSIRLVPGCHAAGFAYDLWLGARIPTQFIAKEDGSDGAHAYAGGGDGAPDAPGVTGDAAARQLRKLGKTFYTLPVFGTAADAEAKYLTRPHGTVFYPTYDESLTVEGAAPGDQPVTYLPQVFNGKETITHLGFKSVYRGIQWNEDGVAGGSCESAMESGRAYLPQVFLTMTEAEMALFGVSSQSEWKTIAPALVPQLNFVANVRENLARTQADLYNYDGMDEQHAVEGVSIKFYAAAQGITTNLMSLIERIGIKLPHDLAFIAGLTKARRQTKDGGEYVLESPLHEAAYHSGPGHDSVLSLAEYTGSLNKLVDGKRYDYHLLTAIDFGDDEDTRAVYTSMPADKRYLLFHPGFLKEMEKKYTPADWAPVYQKYGLPEDLVLSRLTVFAATAKWKRVYAVLKPEHRLHDYIQNETFRRAVRSLVPDPDATLAELEAECATAAPVQTAAATGGGMKRAAEEAPTADAAPPGKRARRAAGAKDESSVLSEDGGDGGSDASDLLAALDEKHVKSPRRQRRAGK